jgi:prepilin-type processing-associated H-X9-DG protein
MAAEYSYIPTQTVAEDANILFLDGSRACTKGFITHRDGSGVFRLKGASNTCKTIYRVTFNANIAVAPAADGGVLGEISIALQEDGETVGNAVAIISAPTAIGDFYNVSATTFVTIPCGCCVSVSVENVSTGTAIDVANANIIFDRVA